MSPQPEPAAGQRRRDSPRTDFSFVPNPPPAPPERQLLRRQMRQLNPPSWALRRANRLEPTIWGEKVCVWHGPDPSLPPAL